MSLVPHHAIGDDLTVHEIGAGLIELAVDHHTEYGATYTATADLDRREAVRLIEVLQKFVGGFQGVANL